MYHMLWHGIVLLLSTWYLCRSFVTTELVSLYDGSARTLRVLDVDDVFCTLNCSSCSSTCSTPCVPVSALILRPGEMQALWLQNYDLDSYVVLSSTNSQPQPLSDT